MTPFKGLYNFIAVLLQQGFD